MQRRSGTLPVGEHGAGQPFQVFVDGALALVSFLLIVFVAIGAHGPPRYVTALVFALFVPGRVVVGFWSTLRAEARLAATVAISVALCTALATLAVAVRLPNVLIVFYLMAVPSMVVLSSSAVRSYRTRRVNG